MKAMEWKIGKMCDDSNSSCGEEHETYDDTESLSDSLWENIRDKLHIWISETTNGKKYLVEGNNIVYFSENGWGRGVIQSKRKMIRRHKDCSKEMRVYILVSYVINRGAWLHDW